jgi:hypothetical protein
VAVANAFGLLPETAPAAGGYPPAADRPAEAALPPLH